jgi:hypothetical protein
MQTRALELARLRAALDHTWLVAAFAGAYAISQATILVVLEPLGSSVAELQCLGFTAAEYLAVFRHWEVTGGMDAYRAHLVLDDVHWVWYAGLFTALLCRLFERQRIPHRFDWLLLLPLVSGLLDGYENRLQHVFLAAPDFSTIVDPLPLLSTLASIAKWILAAVYVALAAGLLLRGAVRGARVDVG